MMVLRSLLRVLNCFHNPIWKYPGYRTTLKTSIGKMRGIIDWSSGRGGFVEDDFCPLEFGEWPAACKIPFIEGYASIRKVPDYKQIMPLLRLNRAVAAVGFTVKRGTWKSKNSKLYQSNLYYLESLTARGGA